MSEEVTDSEVKESLNENSETVPEDTESGEAEKTEKLTRLPLARIRTLIKADQDVTIASQESVFLIAKATEIFVQTMAKEIYRVTQGQKRKTVYKKDFDSVVEMMDEYAFLEGAID
uniref:DNA polymerase epsilon subunit 4-like n=1 Tax=Phallusia mammillata TaxID=59560 RepID=A0A6F9DPU6_9ASCI|nr:DNA polymerase epsilon subunit 4-like [Phallusia mammillata]